MLSKVHLEKVSNVILSFLVIVHNKDPIRISRNQPRMQDQITLSQIL